MLALRCCTADSRPLMRPEDDARSSSRVVVISFRLVVRASTVLFK